MNRITDILAQTPPPTLFHYTSQAGLLGIVESRSLWASEIRYLNDAAELEHAVSLLRDAVNMQLRHASGPWDAYLYCLFERLSLPERPSVFVASLSEDGDLLSQWRAYSPVGLGCSIGFEFTTLSLAMKLQGFKLVKCVYDPAIQQEVIDDLVNYGGKSVVPPYGDETIGRLACDRVIEAFSLVGPLLKHPSFSEEREWRLIQSGQRIDGSQTKFRIGKSTLIPYREFSLTPETSGPVTFSKVYVGPTGNMELSMGAIRSLFAMNAVACSAVAASKVTYRAW